TANHTHAQRFNQPRAKRDFERKPRTPGRAKFFHVCRRRNLGSGAWLPDSAPRARDDVLLAGALAPHLSTIPSPPQVFTRAPRQPRPSATQTGQSRHSIIGLFTGKDRALPLPDLQSSRHRSHPSVNVSLPIISLTERLACSPSSASSSRSIRPRAPAPS